MARTDDAKLGRIGLYVALSAVAAALLVFVLRPG